jgi:Ca-activated chloride channel homolog
VVRRAYPVGYRWLTLGLLMLGWACAPALAAEAPSDLVLVLDASGSMWGQIEGNNKIVIARSVLDGLIDGLPDQQPIGLIAYGHRREGDCEDIETLAAMGPLDREALKAIVHRLQPKGKTPITRSVERAFELVRNRPGSATVILVTDGLETCGGDPCAAVRAAREAGGDFVLHVVGFDVGSEDVSQLECAAQAGGGLYLTADSADQLSVALERATTTIAEVPAGRLVVQVVADGKLHDAWIRVTPTDGTQEVGARTYESPETNPRSIPLPDGRYAVSVSALAIEGDTRRDFEVEIAEGGSVEKVLDFTTGELTIGVTRNRELSDATYRVLVTATGEAAARGRTYTRASSNPDVIRLTPGRYQVEVRNLELDSKPLVDLGEVVVEPRERTEAAHDFTSGELVVGARRATGLVDAVVHVFDSEGRAVTQRRTYTKPSNNPVHFVLAPGAYRVDVQELHGTKKSIAVTVLAGQASEHLLDME